MGLKGSSFASHIPSHPYRWAEKYLHRYVHLKLLHSLNSSELELFRKVLFYTVSGYSANRLHWDRLMFTPSGARWLNGVFKEHMQEGLYLTQQSLKGKALKRGVGSEKGEKGFVYKQLEQPSPSSTEEEAHAWGTYSCCLSALRRFKCSTGLDLRCLSTVTWKCCGLLTEWGSLFDEK